MSMMKSLARPYTGNRTRYSTSAWPSVPRNWSQAQVRSTSGNRLEGVSSCGPMSTNGTRTTRLSFGNRISINASNRLGFVCQLGPNTRAMAEALMDAPNTSLVVWTRPMIGEPVPSSSRSFLPNWLATTDRISVAANPSGIEGEKADNCLQPVDDGSCLLAYE